MKALSVAAIVRALRQAGFDQAICAGGAVRDAINGKPVKDIDIFIAHVGEGLKVRLEAALHMEFKYLCASYGTMGEVNTVWDAVGLEVPVQVIELLPGYVPLDRVATMDFGICQCWNDGYNIDKTPAFSLDFMLDTFTLVQCENKREFERSMRRWKRLSQKYPEFTLVVLDEFKQYQWPDEDINLLKWIEEA